MHNDSFSMVREFLLTHSATIVQDDTGVPVRFLKPERLGAASLRPLSRAHRPRSAAAISGSLPTSSARNRAKPIAFGVGYRWRPNEFNLLLAMRQQRGAER